ncbi:tetratricopeptide repeat protein [Hymenobacter aquaticus]|nr:tetratricopeptide repeat protein [Hymenobacter aquaticus]
MPRHLLLCTLLLLILGLAGQPLAAQDLRDFAYVDSLTLTLSGQERWAALDSLGAAALRAGTDYPALRQRLGYAALRQGHLVPAIRHYGQAVAANPTDEESRTQLARAYLLVNEPGAARLAVATLPDSVRQALHLPAHRAVTQVLVEGSGKPAANVRREAAGFGRIGLSSQLSTRLALTQNLSYYEQAVRLPERRPTPAFFIRQREYAALLTEQVSLSWQVKGAYHFVSNDYGPARYANHLGFAAARFSRPGWSVQLSQYVGRVTDTTRLQTDLQLLAYPLPSARLYVYGRASLIRSAGHTFPNALLGLGAQLSPRLAVEGFGSPGRVPVLFERDAIDVYNVLDPLRYRLGLNTYGQLSGHWRLHFSYLAARYQEIRTLTSYTQHSLTGGLLWTW